MGEYYRGQVYRKGLYSADEIAASLERVRAGYEVGRVEAEAIVSHLQLLDGLLHHAYPSTQYEFWDVLNLAKEWAGCGLAAAEDITKMLRYCERLMTDAQESQDDCDEMFRAADEICAVIHLRVLA